jgi:hypothetical protein
MTRSIEPQPPTQNRLVSNFPAHVYERLCPNLLPVTLSLGEVIYESGGRPEYVYFPTGAVVSLLYTMGDGATAEMGLTGNEGIVGIALFLGGDTTPNRAIVQIAGGALKMRARVLQDEFARGGPVQQLLLRYTQALITQISQTAVCNRLHTVEKRLCRWLLLSHDCVQYDKLVMTHEFISNMLGGAARKRHRCGGSFARCRPHSLLPGPYHHPRSCWLGIRSLRMLPHS